MRRVAHVIAGSFFLDRVLRFRAGPDLALTLALVLVPDLVATARAAEILEADRIVLGASFGEASVVFQDDDAVGFESETLGDFVEAAVGGVGYTDFVNVFTEASQDSTLEAFPDGAFRASGGGAAGVGFDVDDAGHPSRVNGSADSSISILFEVTTPSEFALGVSLEAELAQLSIFSGSGPVEGLVHARFRLFGVATGTVVDFSVEDDVVDDLVVSEQRVLSGILAPDTYLLEVLASSALRGYEDAAGLGTAGFGLDFRVGGVVPEPGTAALVGLGLGLLAARRSRPHWL